MLVVCLLSVMRITGNQIGKSRLYRVRYSLWGQNLAVKIFHESAEGHAWRRELDSLARLAHPNIIRMFYVVYDNLEDRRECRAPLGFAMEAMDHSAEDQREYSLEQFLNVSKQIASALLFCHHTGIIHFDVKPANILLDGACTVAKLCDFGCAYNMSPVVDLMTKFNEDDAITKPAADPPASATASMVRPLRGTLYMAPEAYNGDLESSPHLCDVYSFGKTMWKMLHPLVQVEPMSECKVTSEVPAALKELVEQCTRKHAADRPQDMSDVLERLHSVSAARDTALLTAFIGDCDATNAFKTFKQMVDTRSLNDIPLATCDAFLGVVSNAQAWKKASLPPVPDDLLSQDDARLTCTKVLEFIRAVESYGSTRINRIRVMMVGLGEVGKTRLVKALQSTEFKSEEVAKENRTVAADICNVKLVSPNESNALTACIWDFAGQEVYYMAHSLFMSHRAVYVLVWKRPDECTDDPNALEPAKTGLRRWLEMIGLHAPGAKVVIVGTHCDTHGCGPYLESYARKFLEYSIEIKNHVKEVIAELNQVIVYEDKHIETKMLSENQCDSFLRRRALLRGIHKPSVTSADIAAKSVCQMRIDDRSFFAIDSDTGTGVRDLNIFLDAVGRELIADVIVPKSWSLIEKCMAGGHGCGDVLTMSNAIEQFVRCFHNEILDSLSSPKAHIVTADNHEDCSELVDGDNELPIMHPHDMVFPAQEMMQPHGATSTVGIEDGTAISTLVASPTEPPFASVRDHGIFAVFDDSQVLNEEDRGIANSMSHEDIWQGFLFWHDLGTMYVCSSGHGDSGFVVPDPKVLLDLMKPLVHADPIKMITNQAFQKTFLSPIATEALITEPGRREIEKVLLTLSSMHCIRVKDLKYFSKWFDVGSEEIRRQLLQFYQNHRIIDILDQIDGTDLLTESDTSLEVTARMHIGTGVAFAKYPQNDFTYDLVHLLPVENISMFVHLRSAFLAHTKQLMFPVDCNFFRSNMSSLIEMKRSGICWGQILIEPKSIQVIENVNSLNSLSPILENRISCILRLTCRDTALFALASRCVYEALCSAYPHSNIQCLLSTKHLSYPLLNPWVWLSELRRKMPHGQEQYVSITDFIQSASEHTDIYDLNYQKTSLLHSDLFPLDPVICIVSCLLTDTTSKEFVTSLESSIALKMCVSICKIQISEESTPSPSARIFIVCLTPLFFCNIHCVFYLQRLLVMCAPSTGRKLYVIPLHPSVTRRAIRAIIRNEGMFITCSGGTLLRRKLCDMTSAKSLLIFEVLLEMSMSSQHILNDGWIVASRNEMIHHLYRFVFEALCRNDAMPVLHVDVSVPQFNIIVVQGNGIFLRQAYSSSIELFRGCSGTLSIVQKLAEYGFTSDTINDCVFCYDEQTPESKWSFGLVMEQFQVDIRCVLDDSNSCSSSSSKSQDSSAESFVNVTSSTNTASSSCTQSSSSIVSSNSMIITVRHQCRSGYTESQSSIDSIGVQILQACDEYGVQCCSDQVSDLHVNKVSDDAIDITYYMSGLSSNSISQIVKNQRNISSRLPSEISIESMNQLPLEVLQLKQALASREARISILPPFNKPRSKGSFGIVYKCTSQFVEATGQSCALKVCDFSSVKFDPVHHEGRLLALCGESDYVVRLYQSFDLKELQKRVILMEWIEHGDLRDLMSQLFPLEQTLPHYMTAQHFVEFASHILKALIHLHCEKPGETAKPAILHRDIKPENILVKRNDGPLDLSRVTLKLTDFGLSKAMNESDALSSKGAKRGTRVYKSPESFKFQSCRADDTWSAALVLVELMCGCPVWSEDKSFLVWSKPDASGSAHVEQFREDQLMACCHPWLRAFVAPVLSALKPDVKNRCTDPNVLLEALKRCQDNKNRIVDVFICHDVADVEFATHVEDDLMESGLRVHRASMGRQFFSCCVELLEKAARCARPYLELKLRSLHEMIFSSLSLNEHEKTLLSKSASLYQGGIEANEKEPDAGSLKDIHRRVIKECSGYKVEFFKSFCNADMSEIADQRRGWVEVGKLYTGSLGGHDSAKKKGTSPNNPLGDFDVEFVLNMLKNISEVPESLRTLAKECYDLRNKIIGHHQLGLMGEVSAQTFDTVAAAVASFAKKVIDLSPQSTSSEKLRLEIESYIRETKLKFEEHIIESLLILLQSRCVLPVVSDLTLERFTSLKQGTKCVDEMFIYSTAAFAAKHFSCHKSVSNARVEFVKPVMLTASFVVAPLVGEKPKQQKQNQKGTKKEELPKVAPPEFLFSGNSSFVRSLQGGGGLQDAIIVRRSFVLDGYICCDVPHALLPGVCVMFTGNLKGPKLHVHPNFETIYFVADQDLESTRFKISTDVGGQPLHLQSDGSSMSFRIASDCFFKQLMSVSVEQLCDNFKSCSMSMRSDESCIVDITSELNHMCPLNASTHESEKICRFVICDVFRTKSGPSDDSEPFYSPGEEIIRVKVCKALHFPNCDDPRAGMWLHSLDSSSKFGECLWTLALESIPSESPQFFLLDILVTCSNRSSGNHCFVKDSVWCSCSPCRDHGSDFQIYKRVLRSYLKKLREQDIANSILEAQRDNLFELIPVLFGKVISIKIEQYQLEPQFMLKTESEIMKWDELQQSIFSCQVSVRHVQEDIDALIKSVNQTITVVEYDRFLHVLQETCEKLERYRCSIDDSVGPQETKQRIDAICKAIWSTHDIDFQNMKKRFEKNRPNTYEAEFGRKCRQFELLHDASSKNKLERLDRLKNCFRDVIDFFNSRKADFLQIQKQHPSCQVLLQGHLKKEKDVAVILESHRFSDTTLKALKKDFENIGWTSANIPEWVIDFKAIVDKSMFLELVKDEIEHIGSEVDDLTSRIAAVSSKICHLEKVKDEIGRIGSGFDSLTSRIAAVSSEMRLQEEDLKESLPAADKFKSLSEGCLADLLLFRRNRSDLEEARKKLRERAETLKTEAGVNADRWKDARIEYSIIVCIVYDILTCATQHGTSASEAVCTDKVHALLESSLSQQQSLHSFCLDQPHGSESSPTRFESLETFSLLCSELTALLKDAQQEGCNSCKLAKAELDIRLSSTTIKENVRERLIRQQVLFCSIIDREQVIINELSAIRSTISEECKDLGYTFPDDIDRILESRNKMMSRKDTTEFVAAEFNDFDSIFCLIKKLKDRIGVAVACIENTQSFLSAALLKSLERHGI
jgi:serine/threonine protein kinase/GTPase SAR1 family protein